MRQTVRWVLALMAVTCTMPLPAVENSPVGLWRTFDDKDGLAASLVRIEDQNGQLEGRVVRILPRPGHPVDARCEQCEGARKDQPVTGMTILWGLKREGNVYSGGEILDPEEGHIYRCKIMPKGDRLEVRGYLGISLFGRSQTWQREKE